VIADLSTSNVNAVYELGVRHALRPHTTIVIAEQQFTFPFDLNHLSITKYEHLGKEIGFREVMRMRDVLTQKISAIVSRQETDSPVFLFLPELLSDHRGEGAPPAALLPVTRRALPISWRPSRTRRRRSRSRPTGCLSSPC
jgi:hypothetical protein